MKKKRPLLLMEFLLSLALVSISMPFILKSYFHRQINFEKACFQLQLTPVMDFSFYEIKKILKAELISKNTTLSKEKKIFSLDNYRIYSLKGKPKNLFCEYQTEVLQKKKNGKAFLVKIELSVQIQGSKKQNYITEERQYFISDEN